MTVKVPLRYNRSTLSHLYLWQHSSILASKVCAVMPKKKAHWSEKRNKRNSVSCSFYFAWQIPPPLLKKKTKKKTKTEHSVQNEYLWSSEGTKKISCFLLPIRVLRGTTLFNFIFSPRVLHKLASFISSNSCWRGKHANKCLIHNKTGSSSDKISLHFKELFNNVYVTTYITGGKSLKALTVITKSISTSNKEVHK